MATGSTFKIRKDEETGSTELIFGGTAQVRIRESDGAGPLAKLYEVCDRMAGIVRMGNIGIRTNKTSAIAMLLAVDELKNTLEAAIRETGVLDEEVETTS